MQYLIVFDFLDKEILVALAQNKNLTSYKIVATLKESTGKKHHESVIRNRLRKLQKNQYVISKKIKGRRNHNNAIGWQIDRRNVKYKKGDLYCRFEGDVMHIKAYSRKEHTGLFLPKTT